MSIPLDVDAEQTISSIKEMLHTSRDRSREWKDAWDHLADLSERAEDRYIKWYDAQSLWTRCRITWADELCHLLILFAFGAGTLALLLGIIGLAAFISDGTTVVLTLSGAMWGMLIMMFITRFVGDIVFKADKQFDS